MFLTKMKKGTYFFTYRDSSSQRETLSATNENRHFNSFYGDTDDSNKRSYFPELLYFLFNLVYFTSDLACHLTQLFIPSDFIINCFKSA